MRSANRLPVNVTLALIGAIAVGAASTIAAPPTFAADEIIVEAADTAHPHSHAHPHHDHEHAAGSGVVQSAVKIRSIGSDFGLTDKTIAVKKMIIRAFPQITDIGGYRAHDPYPDHPSGLAIDVMVPGWKTVTGKHLGDMITARAIAEDDVDYVLWRQEYVTRDGAAPMADRGSPTQNHMDHVHIKTHGRLLMPAVAALAGFVYAEGAYSPPPVEIDLDAEVDRLLADEVTAAQGEPIGLRKAGTPAQASSVRRAAPAEPPSHESAALSPVPTIVDPIVKFVAPMIRSRLGPNDDEDRPRAEIDDVDLALADDGPDLDDLRETTGSRSIRPAGATLRERFSQRNLRSQTRKSADFSDRAADPDQARPVRGRVLRPSRVSTPSTASSDGVSATLGLGASGSQGAKSRAGAVRESSSFAAPARSSGRTSAADDAGSSDAD